MGLTARVFDISRACVEDGPGIRTVVFLKGCALGCPWCHNPEGKSFEAEIAFNEKLCIDCRKCWEACPRDWPAAKPDGWRIGCAACGLCAEACPSGARRLAGRVYEAEELAIAVSQDAEFFAGTDGGVTFSGGEPLAHPDFVFACAQKLRDKGIHCAVETSGFWPNKLADEVIKRFDLILFDLKHVSDSKFRKFMGKGNRLILRNLQWLCESDAEIELRLTVVPSFNDTREDLYAIAKWMKRLTRIPPLKLQPFHRLATAKQRLFRKSYPFAGVEPVSEAKIKEATEVFRGEGIFVQV